MALPFFQKKARVATITLEKDAIRYVELKSTEPVSLIQAEEVILPAGIMDGGKVADSAALLTELGKAVDQWGLSKKSVRFLAPDEFVIIRKVPYPQNVEVDELKGHFFIEIGSTLYLPFEDPVFDVVPYRLDSDEPEAIIIASKESVIQDYERAFEGVKLDPLVADIAPLALYRLAYLQHEVSEDDHIMLIDVHGKKMTVSIFHEHFPMFMRPVDLELLIEDPEDPAQLLVALEEEAEKLGNFYRFNMNEGKQGITKVICNGEFENWNIFGERLSARLQIGVEPLVRNGIEAGGKLVPPRFNRAIGLALKEV